MPSVCLGRTVIEKGVKLPVPVNVTNFDFAFRLVIVNDDTDIVQVVPLVHRALAVSLDGLKCAGVPLMFEFGRVMARPAAAPLVVPAASAAGVSASVSSTLEAPIATVLWIPLKAYLLSSPAHRTV